MKHMIEEKRAILYLSSQSLFENPLSPEVQEKENQTATQ